MIYWTKTGYPHVDYKRAAFHFLASTGWQSPWVTKPFARERLPSITAEQVSLFDLMWQESYFRKGANFTVWNVSLWLRWSRCPFLRTRFKRSVAAVHKFEYTHQKPSSKIICQRQKLWGKVIRRYCKHTVLHCRMHCMYSLYL